MIVGKMQHFNLTPQALEENNKEGCGVDVFQHTAGNLSFACLKQ